MANPFNVISAAILAIGLYVLFQECLSPAGHKRRRLSPCPPVIPSIDNFPIVNVHTKFKNGQTSMERYSVHHLDQIILLYCIVIVLLKA